MKLTDKELRQIIIEEMKLISTSTTKSSKTQEQLLREGLWSKLKYFVAKVPPLEQGGSSVFNRSKNAKEAAEKYKQILEKESNKLIKDLMDKIAGEVPGFPNNEKPEDFTSALTDFYIVYDALVAATKKWKSGVPADEQEEGAFDPVAANAIILDLRSVVKNLSDLELGDAYKHALEEERQHALKEERKLAWQREKQRILEEEKIEELFGLGKKKDKWAEKEQELARTEKTKEQGATAAGTVLDPKTALKAWEGLKSMKLPAVLGIMGAGAGLLGVLSKTKWFADIIGTTIKEGGYKYITEPRTAVEAITKKVADFLRPGEGILRVIERISGTDLTGVGATTDDLLAAMKTGFGNSDEGAKMLSELGLKGNPAEFMASWGDRVTGVAGDTPLSEVFSGAFSGETGIFGMQVGPLQKMVHMGWKKVVKEAGKEVASTGFTVAGGGAATIGAASTVLAPLGVALVTAGGLIAALRKKSAATWGSRTRLLQDLYKQLKMVPVPKELEPLVASPEDEPAGAPDPEQLLSQFKVGDIVIYTEVEPKADPRDVSMAQIIALPGGEGIHEDLQEKFSTKGWRERGAERLAKERGEKEAAAKAAGPMIVKSVAEQFEDEKNMWAEGSKDKQGNSKKIFAQLQIIAVRSGGRNKPISLAPILRDEGDGFKSYITKVEEVPKEVLAAFAPTEKPKKPVPAEQKAVLIDFDEFDEQWFAAGEAGEAAAGEEVGVEQTPEEKETAEQNMQGEEGYKKLGSKYQDILKGADSAEAKAALESKAPGFEFKQGPSSGLWYGKKKSEGAEGRRNRERNRFGQDTPVNRGAGPGFAAKRDDVQENTLNESKAYDRWSVLANIEKVEK